MSKTEIVGHHQRLKTAPYAAVERYLQIVQPRVLDEEYKEILTQAMSL